MTIGASSRTSGAGIRRNNLQVRYFPKKNSRPLKDGEAVFFLHYLR